MIELILAIAFFSLASAVCVQLFVKSHLLSKEAAQLNTGVNLVTSAAEIFRQSYGDMDAVTDFMPELEAPNSKDFYTAYYNEEGLPCAKSDADYILTLTPERTEDTLSPLLKFYSREIIILFMSCRCKFTYRIHIRKGEQRWKRKNILP